MIKIGIIGLGSISDKHISAFLTMPDVKLTALCDINVDRLNENAEKLNIQDTFTDYRQLIEEANIDAVSICTTNNSHARIVIAAIEAGKHVFVEKPLSTSLEETEAIYEAAYDADVVVGIGMVRRFADNAKVLKESIEDGKLGEIYYTKASFLRRLGHPGGWFGDVEKSGGGPLMDLGVHLLDLCWYLIGRPRVRTISANTYHVLGEREHINYLNAYKAIDQDINEVTVEDLANVLIRFENGSSLYLDTSYTLHTLKDQLSVEFFGDKGGAVLEPQLTVTTESNDLIVNIEPQMTHRSFHNEAYYREIDNFVKAIKGDEELLSPVEDAVYVMKIIDGIYHSASIQEEVKMERTVRV